MTYERQLHVPLDISDTFVNSKKYFDMLMKMNVSFIVNFCLSKCSFSLNSF